MKIVRKLKKTFIFFLKIFDKVLVRFSRKNLENIQKSKPYQNLMNIFRKSPPPSQFFLQNLTKTLWKFSENHLCPLKILSSKPYQNLMKIVFPQKWSYQKIGCLTPPVKFWNVWIWSKNVYRERYHHFKKKYQIHWKSSIFVQNKIWISYVWSKFYFGKKLKISNEFETFFWNDDISLCRRFWIKSSRFRISRGESHILFSGRITFGEIQFS